MALALTVGLVPASLAVSADAAETADGEKEMWEIALENGYTHYDTIDMCGGNSHLQGICVDDKMEYMYFSYTSALAKVDMKTGEVVGSVGGFGQGSFGTPGGAHLGCLAYYDGKIYGSLEYKDPGKKFFIAVFDEDAITEVGMDIKEMDTGVYGILLEEPTADFRDPLNDGDQITSEDGYAVNEENLGHKYGCSGIDGVTFGTMPGDDSGKIYLFVAYGIYGNNDWDERYDNNYNVLQVYDPEKFDSTDDSVLRRFTYERGLSLDYEADEALAAEDTLYVWTGTTGYGSQNLEVDKDTGDIVLYTYAPIRDWSDGHTLYVVDGSKAPVEREIEVGQSNTNPDQAAHDAAVAKAEAYQVNGAYPTGKHAVLKCICGENCQAEVCGDTGVTAMVCGGTQPQKSTTGIASIGNGYYYIADGDTTASLYRRDENYNFTRVGSTFTDVPETFWAYEAISWANENGYMNGTSDTTFTPNGSVSRQQVWMILARLSGAAPADMTAAREWAVENDISDGSNPGGAVTRQQLAALLYRYAQSQGKGFTGEWAFQLDYPDADQVGEYAYEALCWMTMNEIIGGTAQGTLNPGGTATRAQLAVILDRFCGVLAEEA